MLCSEQDHRKAVISDRLVSIGRVSGSPVIPFAMAYDRVHGCLTSVLCRFLIYEMFVHAADTQSSKLMHLLDIVPRMRLGNGRRVGDFISDQRLVTVTSPWESSLPKPARNQSFLLRRESRSEFCKTWRLFPREKKLDSQGGHVCPAMHSPRFPSCISRYQARLNTRGSSES